MGFSIRWRWLDLCRLRWGSGETRCRTGRVPLGKRSVTHPIREYGGEIFTDYYFGEANTANKSDNHHNNAINKKFNCGGIYGLLQYCSLLLIVLCFHRMIIHLSSGAIVKEIFILWIFPRALLFPHV